MGKRAGELDDRGATLGRPWRTPPTFPPRERAPAPTRHKMALLGAGVTSPRNRAGACSCPYVARRRTCSGWRRAGTASLPGRAQRRRGARLFDEKGLPRATSAAGGVPARATPGASSACTSRGTWPLSRATSSPWTRKMGRRIAEANRNLPEPDLFGDAPSERRLVRDAVATLRRVTGGAVTKSVARHASDPEASSPRTRARRRAALHQLHRGVPSVRRRAGRPWTPSGTGALVAVAPDMRRRYARVIAAHGPGRAHAVGGHVVRRGHQQPRGGTAPPGPPFSVRSARCVRCTSPWA